MKKKAYISGKITGMEALLRWTHSEHGFIPPDEFISIAEQTGIMRYLTRWVFKRALRDQAKRNKVFGSSSISVNISAVNLHEPDFEETILELLETYDIQPEELILEIENIVSSGTKINIDYYLNNIIDEDAQKEIYDYFLEDAESDDISEAYEEFDGDYSEDELRLMKIKFMSEMAN